MHKCKPFTKKNQQEIASPSARNDEQPSILEPIATLQNDSIQNYPCEVAAKVRFS